MKNKHGIELRQWAVVRARFRPSDRDLHPAVIVSNDEDCADERLRRLNLLHGTKIAPGNPARSHQVVLNSAEGLDFRTAIDCGDFYSMAKDDIMESVGEISPERRRILKRAIIAVYRLL